MNMNMSIIETDLMNTRRIFNNNVKHIAVIPDGNRRWARSRGMEDEDGHVTGFLKTTPAWMVEAWKSGLHTITLWLFSTDKWNRSDREISILMEVYENLLEIMYEWAKRLSVRMVHLGRKDRIPVSLREIILKIEESTGHFIKHQFNFAIDYGGKDEITRMVRQIVADGIPEHDICEALLYRYLDTGRMIYDNPDIIIRTSGETRLSGFMPWQGTHSECIFLDKMYPDLRFNDVYRIIKEYE